MPKSNRRAIRSQLTKQMLYESAMQLFRENGYYNTTVEDIAAGVGASVGAFYYHFKSKEDVIFLRINELNQNYEDFYNLQLSSSGTSSALERLRSMLMFMISTYCSVGREFAAIMYSYMMREPEAAALMIDENRVDRRILRSLVEQGKLEGCLRADIDVRNTADDLVKLIRGSVLDWCVANAPHSVDEYSRSFVDTFLAGLVPNQNNN